MNEKIFERTKLLLGNDAINKLQASKVAVFGVGGVGSFVVEALVRAGIGHISIVDSDTVSETNLNRQLIALHSTIGRKKVEVASERLLDINPNLDITTYDIFYSSQTKDLVSLDGYDYIVDAIDTVTSKLMLVILAKQKNIKIISSMGTGNKLNTQFIISDIKKTSVCPLARVMRKELKELGIDSLKVLWSDEVPLTPTVQLEEHGRHIPASISFVPGSAGLLIASEVVRDLIGDLIRK